MSLRTIKIETVCGPPPKSPPCLSTRTALTRWLTAPLAETVTRSASAVPLRRVSVSAPVAVCGAWGEGEEEALVAMCQRVCALPVWAATSCATKRRWAAWRLADWRHWACQQPASSLTRPTAPSRSPWRRWPMTPVEAKPRGHGKSSAR